MKKPVSFIGVASGQGAQISETEKGPETLRLSGVLNDLSPLWEWKETLKNAGIPTPLLSIEDLCRRTALSVAETLKSDQFPMTIGGDHTIAIGTWAGVVHALKARQKFGLIWIDAHMDAHTMETSPSKAYHGMPLAALLGFGEASLTQLLDQGPVLDPKHVCLIGVRSYEPGEEALLKRLGVRVYYMAEMRERGFSDVLQEAIHYVKTGTVGFGVTIDLDAFDPEDAPGVGSPAPGGLRTAEALPALTLLQEDPAFKALEIVEYNPDLDKNNKTLSLMREILMKFVV